MAMSAAISAMAGKFGVFMRALLWEGDWRGKGSGNKDKGQ